jgi:hypothetical protein
MLSALDSLQEMTTKFGETPSTEYSRYGLWLVPAIATAKGAMSRSRDTTIIAGRGFEEVDIPEAFLDGMLPVASQSSFLSG